MMKIDVCIVTRDESPSNYHNIVNNVSVNNIIIERSTPVGLARMRAIQKVKTEWFAFIDDDVYLTESSFYTLIGFIGEGIGAVAGMLHHIGLGEKWDRDVEAFRASFRYVQKLRVGDRGATTYVILRTQLVRDWKPSRDDLSAWDDYEITQHILKKGYEWLVVPVEGYHIWSWRKRWSSALRDMENWKRINAKKLWPRVMASLMFDMFRILFDWGFTCLPFRTRIYHLRAGSIYVPVRIGFLPFGARIYYLQQTLAYILELLMGINS